MPCMNPDDGPRTCEDFDRIRRTLDKLPWDTTSDEYADLHIRALQLIARGHSGPEGLAQAALGPQLLDQHDDREPQP